jgi:transposase
MAKVEIFCGIDVSKKTFDVSIEENGGFRSKKFSYDDSGMSSLLNFMPSGAWCVLESTGTYHCRLAYFLFEHGVRLSVVNPLSVKRYSQSLMLRAKTDKADSRMLIMYAKAFQLKQWKPKKASCVELQQLLNLQEQFIKQSGMLKNQREAVCQSVVKNNLVKEMLDEAIRRIEMDLKRIENEMEALMQKHEKENYDNICLIPGIGKKTAIVLLAFTQGMEDFSSAKQVSSYFGLCPRVYDSGTSVRGKAHICKMGMAMVRKLLYMCALSAKNCNKACRELYDRLVQQGKKKKLALIAVANKLLRQVFAIIKNKLRYDDKFSQKKFAF